MNKAMRRLVAGAGTLALGASMVAVMGAGQAGAAPTTERLTSGGFDITRTLSNTTPVPGDVITVQTDLHWNNPGLPTMNTVSDVHDACLTYVVDSAKRDGNPIPSTNITAESTKVSVSFYEIFSQYQNPAPRFEFKYTVGYGCARATDINSSVITRGNLGGDQAPANMGPKFTVAKTSTNTTLDQAIGLTVGTAYDLRANVLGGKLGDIITFKDFDDTIGTAAVDAAGYATFSWTPSESGVHGLSASFASTSFAVASSSTTQRVTVAASAVDSDTVLSGAGSPRVDVATPLTASISPAGAGGTVGFYHGATLLGTTAVLSNGKATYNWVPSAAGDITITAKFSGRDGVSGSQSSLTFGVLPKSVDAVATTTTLATNGELVLDGSVTLTAQISAPGATGSVTFSDGNIVIGVAQVQSNGFATLVWTPTQQGARTLKAEYSGAPLFNASADTEDVLVAAPTPIDPGTPGGGGGDGGMGSLDFGNLFGSMGI